MYLSLSSYADEGCEIEILSKEMIAPDRYNRDFSGMVLKKIDHSISKKGENKCYNTLDFRYNTLLSQKINTIDTSIDLKASNKAISANL